VTEIDPKLSRLYHEASTEGPPAALDAAILAAAGKRVAKPQRRQRSSWLRWMAPATAIATLVLGVSIALLVEREQPATTADTIINQTSPRPQSPQPARVTESAKPKAAGSAAPEAAAKKGTPAATLPTQAPVPRPAAPAPSAAEALPAESRAKAATESNVAGDSANRGAGAAASAAPAAAGKLAPMRQQAIQRSPEAWLDEISRLKREGREKEAAEQLAEFRKAYPAYALPENLRGLQ
jgi:cytoskeletal protein RodZ